MATTIHAYILIWRTLPLTLNYGNLQCYSRPHSHSLEECFGILIPKDDFEQIQQSAGLQDALTCIEPLQIPENARNISRSFRVVKAFSEKLYRFGGALDILAQGAL